MDEGALLKQFPCGNLSEEPFPNQTWFARP